MLVPVVFSLDCNTVCLDSGYSSGICTDACSGTLVEGADDCALAGQAVLVVGTDAITTHKDADPFIGEDKDDVQWTWIIKNLKTKASTNILDTNADTAHSGPLLSIKNKFIATDIDGSGVDAVASGGSLCFPNNIICIKFNKLTVSDYATYTIQKTTVDLSQFNSSWSNKNSILIKSVDDANGLQLDVDGYDISIETADGATTDNIWIIYNSTGNYSAVYYEDATNVKKLAGFLNMDSTGDDINIADVNYKNTKGTDIQLDLRRSFSTANNLDLVLDILGFEGAAATEGSDDTTINLRHSANSDFSGLGNTSATADDGDLTWVSRDIGTKDEDHRTLYGIIIKDPKTNGASDKVELKIPGDQVKAEIEISRSASTITKIKTSQKTVLGEQIPSPILASELKFKEDHNIIFVGGPCANLLLEEFSDFPKCKEWPLKAGEAMIKFSKNGNNAALLIAGTNAEDTKMATEFMKSFDNYSLKGTYIKIVDKNPQVLDSSVEGFDYSDYPVPFIKNGKFQKMLLVVGDKAEGKDTIGALDISSSLMTVTRTSSNLTEEEIDSDALSTKEEIPLGTNLAGANFFREILSHSSIPSLIDHELSFSGENYNYEETLMLYSSGPSIETSLSSSDDNYKSNVYMEATAGSMRYYFAFKEDIDVSTASVNQPLTINMLENELSITKVNTATEFESQIANKYFMNTNEKIVADGIQVHLLDIAPDGSIKVNIVNSTGGTATEIIKSGQNKNLAGINIKNLEAFDETTANCCCKDLLSSLS